MKYLLLIALLAGCASTSVENTPRVRGTFNLPDAAKPAPIVTRPVNVEVIDKEKMIVLLRDPEFRRLVGLTQQDYENLLFNISDAARYIEIQNAIIEYYQNSLRELNERQPI